MKQNSQPEREPYKQPDTIKAFEHLEQLLNDLPNMTQKSDRVIRAARAEEVLAVNRRYEANKRELDKLDSQLEEVTHATEQATVCKEDPHSVESLESLQRTRMYYAAMRGFKVGPVQNDAQALKEALSSGGFASIEEAQAALLSPEEMTRLTKEVEQYQADYAQTLALCQELE